MKLSFEKGFFAPLPVLIIGTYDANGTPDAMNAAWGGQIGMTQISVSLSSSHKTTANIRLNREFTVAFATAEQIAACDYVGVASGNKVGNKLEKCGFTCEGTKRQAKFVNTYADFNIYGLLKSDILGSAFKTEDELTVTG